VIAEETNFSGLENLVLISPGSATLKKDVNSPQDDATQTHTSSTQPPDPISVCSKGTRT
jgi:hypothetical protein